MAAEFHNKRHTGSRFRQFLVDPDCLQGGQALDTREVLPVGTLLDGSYRVVRVVGSGGFGITYEAEDMKLGTVVAVKEYYPFDFGERDKTMSVRPKTDRHRATFDWGLSNFVREARTLAQFEHPNIVRVTRVFEVNSTAYMVMRFERGQNFEEWLNGLGRLPTQPELDAIAAPLLDALEVLHAANFLHRDLAPDNIVVRADGTPVLLDFGAARRAVAERSHTLTGIVKAGYSPHEQYSSDGRLQGPWSDLFAFGGTLYRAVAGRAPEEATLRVDHDFMPRAADIGKGRYRPAFLAAIDACLKVRPSQRPQSVAELRPKLLNGGGGSDRSLGTFTSQSASRLQPRATPARRVFPTLTGRWPIVLTSFVAISGGAIGGYVYTNWRPSEISDSDAAKQLELEAAKRRADALEEKSRQAAIAADRRTKQVEKQRKDAEEQASKQAAVDAEKRRKEVEETGKRLDAEKQRKAAEEKASQQAALEAQQRRKEAEDAARRQAALDAEKQRIEVEEKAKQQAALETENRRKEVEEAAKRQAALDAEKRRKETEEVANRRKAEIEAERAHLSDKFFRDCDSCPELVPVLAGRFVMGSNKEDVESGLAAPNEAPQREVEIKRPLAVGRFEITKDEFETFVRAAGHKIGNSCWTLEGNEPKERDNRSFRNPGFVQLGSHPVVCVAWDDATAYAGWLSQKTGKAYRLLSESEWEYVARAGTTAQYPLATAEADLCALGNGADQTASAAGLPSAWAYLPCRDGFVHTAPVGSFKPIRSGSSTLWATPGSGPRTAMPRPLSQ